MQCIYTKMKFSSCSLHFIHVAYNTGISGHSLLQYVKGLTFAFLTLITRPGLGYRVQFPTSFQACQTLIRAFLHQAGLNTPRSKWSSVSVKLCEQTPEAMGTGRKTLHSNCNVLQLVK